MKNKDYIIEFRNISKSFGEKCILDDISFYVKKGEFITLLGPSGCGKTTLLNIIGGLDQYTQGDLVINGRSTKSFKDSDWDTYRNHSIGFVFQSYNLIPHQSVLQNVELALTLSGVSKAERRKRAVQALESVGLGNQLRKKPAQMSGGQMQRVAIARALMLSPKILCFDEPTSALDPELTKGVLNVIKELAKEKMTMVIVTHEMSFARDVADRIIFMDGGVIVEEGPAYELVTNPKQERTKAFLAGY